MRRDGEKDERDTDNLFIILVIRVVFLSQNDPILSILGIQNVKKIVLKELEH